MSIDGKTAEAITGISDMVLISDYVGAISNINILLGR
jgi:hypothetical protein